MLSKNILGVPKYERQIVYNVYKGGAHPDHTLLPDLIKLAHSSFLNT